MTILMKQPEIELPDAQGRRNTFTLAIEFSSASRVLTTPSAPAPPNGGRAVCSLAQQASISLAIWLVVCSRQSPPLESTGRSPPATAAGSDVCADCTAE